MHTIQLTTDHLKMKLKVAQYTENCIIDLACGKMARRLVMVHSPAIETRFINIVMRFDWRIGNVGIYTEK